jgi:hypothetical protein
MEAAGGVDPPVAAENDSLRAYGICTDRLCLCSLLDGYKDDYRAPTRVGCCEQVIPQFYEWAGAAGCCEQVLPQFYEFESHVFLCTTIAVWFCIMRRTFFGVLEMLRCYNPCVVSLIGGASSEMFLLLCYDITIFLLQLFCDFAIIV